MDILNFISWLKAKRQFTVVHPEKTLLPIGVKDPKRDDDYLAGAILVQDFINQIGTGVVGPAGPQGPIGPQGVVGPQGAQGDPGIQGATGPQGSQGIQGIQGDAGPVGPAGLTWQGLWSSTTVYAQNDAVSYLGATYFCYNPAGVGPSGIDPVTDTANWALVAAQGATGPQGPAGATGPVGPQGPQGLQGIQGPIGLTGATGPQGPQGASGTPAFVSTGSFSTTAAVDTILVSVLIPANTYTSPGAFDIMSHYLKNTGYAASGTYWINTSNTLVGAQRLATSNMVTGNRFMGFKRTFFINGAVTTFFADGVSQTADVGLSGSSGQTATVDWTQDQYILIVGASDGTNILTVRGVRIY